MFVADIEDKCILGIDFLTATDDESNLQFVLGIKAPKSFGKKEKFACARVNYCTRSFLSELFKRDSKNLNFEQKEKFAWLSIEFQDIYSEDIVTGNCDIEEHKIKLLDPRPIK